jgi:hypothetical protein
LICSTVEILGCENVYLNGDNGAEKNRSDQIPPLRICFTLEIHGTEKVHLSGKHTASMNRSNEMAPRGVFGAGGICDTKVRVSYQQYSIEIGRSSEILP